MVGEDEKGRNDTVGGVGLHQVDEMVLWMALRSERHPEHLPGRRDFAKTPHAASAGFLYSIVTSA